MSCVWKNERSNGKIHFGLSEISYTVQWKTSWLCFLQKKKEKKIYEIGCLCVIPEFQGKGIGTQAIEFVKEFYKDWEEFTLITPADKLENVKFYSEKCGFNIESTEKDGNVKVVRLVLGKYWFTLEAITQ